MSICYKSISVNRIYIAQWDKQDWVVSHAMTLPNQKPGKATMKDC